jgi:DNA primase catalytic subunit
MPLGHRVKLRKYLQIMNQPESHSSANQNSVTTNSLPRSSSLKRKRDEMKDEQTLLQLVNKHQMQNKQHQIKQKSTEHLDQTESNKRWIPNVSAILTNEILSDKFTDTGSTLSRSKLGSIQRNK